MMAARAQQLVARGDFDEDGDVPPRRDRHPDHRHPRCRAARRTRRRARGDRTRAPCSHRSSWTTSSTRFDERVDATPNRSWTLMRPSPRISMWWRVSSGQVPMTNDCGPAAQLDRVVGHQAMAADDEVERALALADAALADDEHAEAEDVHQDAVDRCRAPPGTCRGAPTAGTSRRAWRPASAAAARRRGRLPRALPAAASKPPVTSRHGSRWLKTRRNAEPRSSASASRGSGFALAEDQDAPAAQVGVEAGQREAGLLRCAGS